MYSDIDYIISGINDNSIYSKMEWQDYLLQDSINELNNLSPEEWQKLYSELPNKPIEWKKRFAECLTNFNDKNQLQAFCILLNDNDVELFDILLAQLLHYNFNDVRSIIEKLGFADEYIERVKNNMNLVNENTKGNYNIFLERISDESTNAKTI